MFMSLEGLRLSGSAVHSLIPTWGVHQVPGRGALKVPRSSCHGGGQFLRRLALENDIHDVFRRPSLHLVTWGLISYSLGRRLL